MTAVACEIFLEIKFCPSFVAAKEKVNTVGLTDNHSYRFNILSTCKQKIKSSGDDTVFEAEHALAKRQQNTSFFDRKNMSQIISKGKKITKHTLRAE